MFISDTLHSPSPNALEPPLESLLLDRSAPDVCAMDKFTRLCMLFLHPTTYHHHPVRGRGYHLAGSNNTRRMDRRTVRAIKIARRSRGSNTILRTSSATTSAAALRAPEPLH